MSWIWSFIRNMGLSSPRSSDPPKPSAKPENPIQPPHVRDSIDPSAPSRTRISILLRDFGRRFSDIAHQRRDYADALHTLAEQTPHELQSIPPDTVFPFLVPRPGSTKASDYTTRLLEACPSFNGESIKAYLEVPIPSTSQVSLDALDSNRGIIEAFGPNVGGEILQRIVRVNTALFTGPTLDLCNRSRTITPASWRTLPRWGTEPEPPEHGDHEQRETGLQPLTSHPIEGTDIPFHFFNEVVPSTIPEGKRLALAMLDVNRILFQMVEDHLAPKMKGPAYDTMLERYTFQKDPKQVLWEGILTVSQVLSILLLYPTEPPKPLEQVLDDLAKSELPTAIGRVAPFGATGSLSQTGYPENPHGPSGIVYSARTSPDHPSVPAIVVDRIRQLRNVRQGVPSDLEATETLRGCPIARSGVVVNAKGNLAWTKEPPMSSLVTEYIRLLKIAYAAQPARN